MGLSRPKVEDSPRLSASFLFVEEGWVARVVIVAAPFGTRSELTWRGASPQVDRARAGFTASRRGTHPLVSSHLQAGASSAAVKTQPWVSAHEGWLAPLGEGLQPGVREAGISPASRQLLLRTRSITCNFKLITSSPDKITQWGK